MSEGLRVIIAGDLCPVGRFEAPLRSAAVTGLLGDLFPALSGADLFLANLECPLIDRSDPIRKSCPVLQAVPGTLNGIAEMGVGLLGLANNHIMDHGPSGLESTVTACTSAGIATVGAGMDLDSARTPFRKRWRGTDLTVFAAAETEFSIAGPDRPGAAPLDGGRLLLDVRREADKGALIVVLLHAGFEGYPYPTPRQQQTCRLLAEAGASLIVCQHSHCPGAYEFHEKGLIVYGQGNFLFDWPSGGPDWDLGFLIDARLAPGAPPNFTILPYRSSPATGALRGLEQAERTAFEDRLTERSREILRPEAVEARWRDLCHSMGSPYLTRLLFHHPLLRKAARATRMDRWFWGREGRRVLLNLIRCGIHREVLETVLDDDAD